MQGTLVTAAATITGWVEPVFILTVLVLTVLPAILMWLGIRWLVERARGKSRED